jgi:hypothetical protein
MGRLSKNGSQEGRNGVDGVNLLGTGDGHFVNSVTKFRVPLMAGNFLSNGGAINVSRRAFLHRVRRWVTSGSVSYMQRITWST